MAKTEKNTAPVEPASAPSAPAASPAPKPVAPSKAPVVQQIPLVETKSAAPKDDGSDYDYSDMTALEAAPEAAPEVSETEAEPEATEPEAAEAPVEAETDDGPPIPFDVLDAAQSLGISEQQVRQHAKEYGVRATELEVINIAQKREFQRKLKEAEGSRPAETPKAEFDLGLGDDSDIDPKITGAFKKLHSHYEAKIKALEESGKQDREAREAELKQIREQAIVAEFDRAIATLDEPVRKLLGDGDSFSISPTSSEAKNRKTLSDAVGILAQGYRAAGLPIPPMNRLIKKAAAMEFADSIRASARKEVADKVQKRNGQVIQKPSRTEGRPKTGEAAAIAVANRLRQQYGLDTYTSGADDQSGLLD